MRFKSTLIAAIILCSGNLFAQSRSSMSTKDMKVSIEPLAGFETLYRPYPTPHTVTRTMFGVRLTAGSDLISAEAEYTQGNDTENFLTAPEKIETKDNNYKLGIRSTYKITDWAFSSIRLGGHATESTVTETNAGVPTTTKKPMEYHPYLGAHIGAKLGPISVSIGATAIIRDTANISNNDVQHTLSVSLGR